MSGKDSKNSAAKPSIELLAASTRYDEKLQVGSGYETFNHNDVDVTTGNDQYDGKQSTSQTKIVPSNDDGNTTSIVGLKLTSKTCGFQWLQVLAVCLKWADLLLDILVLVTVIQQDRIFVSLLSLASIILPYYIVYATILRVVTNQIYNKDGYGCDKVPQMLIILPTGIIFAFIIELAASIVTIYVAIFYIGCVGFECCKIYDKHTSNDLRIVVDRVGMLLRS